MSILSFTGGADLAVLGVFQRSFVEYYLILLSLLQIVSGVNQHESFDIIAVHAPKPYTGKTITYFIEFEKTLHKNVPQLSKISDAQLLQLSNKVVILRARDDV